VSHTEFPPNVLFLLDIPTPQRVPVLDRLANDLGFAVRVLYESHSDQGRGWGTLEIRHPHDFLPSSPLGSVYRVVAAAADRDISVICCFGYDSWSKRILLLAARALGKPVVMRTDSNDADEDDRPAWRTRLKGVALRRLLGPKSLVWTVGSANERYWRTFGLTRLERIPYATPRPPVARPEEAAAFRAGHGFGDAFLFLYVGRLHPVKGITDLLAAFAQCSVAPVAVILAIVGDGPQAPEVRRKAARHDNVHILGSVPHSRLGAAYRAADVVVVPSRKEPWGLVVNEALANGTPVIVSDRVGASEDLVRWDRGWRFPAGDVHELLKCLRAAIERGPLRVEPPEVPDVAAMMAASLSDVSRRPVRRWLPS